MKKGGYVKIFNITTLTGAIANIDYETFSEYDKKKEEYRLDILKKRDKLLNEFKEFITMATSVIIIDFIVLNHEIGYFTIYIVQIHNGNLGFTFKVNSYPINSGSIIFPRILRETVSSIFLSISLIRFIFLISLNFYYALLISRKNSEYNTNNIINNNNNILFLVSSKINKIKSNLDKEENNDNINKNKDTNNIKFSIIKSKNFKLCDFLLEFIKLFFNSIWGLLDLIIISLSLVISYDLFQFGYANLKNRKRYDNSAFIYNIVLDKEFNNELLDTRNYYEILITLIAICGLFFFASIFNIVKKISLNLKIYLKGLYESLSDLIAFFVILFIIILSISIIFNFYYSKHIFDFIGYFKTIAIVLFYLIGSSAGYTDEMYKFSPIMTIIITIIICFIIKKAIKKLILAIIMYNFDFLKLLKKNKYKETTMGDFKNQLNDTYLNNLKNYICNFFIRKNKTQIPNDNKNIRDKDNESIVNSETNLKMIEMKKIEDHNKNMNPIEMNKKIDNIRLGNKISNFNEFNLTPDDLRFVHLQFNENFEITERNPYFDSERDKNRLNIHYTKLVKKNLSRNARYILVIIFATLAIIWNDHSVWNYNFMSLIKNLLKFDNKNWRIQDIGNLY
jgi:hypothetical protein